MDSNKKIEEFDSTQIKTEEIEKPDGSEEWDLVSEYEAEPSLVPYISFPQMHDISESVDSLFDQASTEQNEQGEFSEQDQESGGKIEDKLEILSLHEQNEGATGGVHLSESSQFEQKQENAEIRKENNEVLHEPEQQNARGKREMVELLQDFVQYNQDNEKLRAKMADALKVSSQLDSESERLRTKMVGALQNMPQLSQGNERLKTKVAQVLEGVLRYDQYSERLRRKMVETQFDPESERLRREVIEAMQEVPPPARGHQTLSRAMIEDPEDSSQHDHESEWIGREMIEVLQDASHYQQENERVRKEIFEAKQVVTQYEQENERVRKEIAEAMQDASQYEQEKERVQREISEAMQEVSQCEKESKGVTAGIEASNELFVRHSQKKEFKSLVSYDHNSESLESSADTATFQESDKPSQEINEAEQDNTIAQSTASSKLQIQATGCESSTAAIGCQAVNCDFMDSFVQFFKSNFKAPDASTDATSAGRLASETNLQDKLPSQVSESILKEDSSSADKEENKETDTSKEGNN